MWSHSCVRDALMYCFPVAGFSVFLQTGFFVSPLLFPMFPIHLLLLCPLIRFYSPRMQPLPLRYPNHHQNNMENAGNTQDEEKEGTKRRSHGFDLHKEGTQLKGGGFPRTIELRNWVAYLVPTLI